MRSGHCHGSGGSHYYSAGSVHKVSMSTVTIQTVGRDISVQLGNGRPKESWFQSRQGQEMLSSRHRPTQSPYIGVGACFPGTECDHPLPDSGKVKNERGYTSTSPYTQPLFYALFGFLKKWTK